MPEIHFDRFYRYAELTGLVEAWASEYPHLCRLESMGKSYEGRDIWILTHCDFVDMLCVWVFMDFCEEVFGLFDVEMCGILVEF